MFGLIDVLVICPVDEEVQALKKQFTKAGFLVQTSKTPSEDCKSMFLIRITAQENPASVINVCVVQALEQGILRAACLASILLVDMRPKLVVSFGIAGVFEGEGIKLGSVCFPGKIIYYEPAKDSEKSSGAGKEPQSIRENASVSFDCDRGEYASPNFDNFSFMVIRDKPLASGEKLVADKDSTAKKDAKSSQRHVIGIDMEAAGVACACEMAPKHRRPKFIAIKGFSDYATQKSKNPETAEARKKQNRERKLAANNAATFLVAFLNDNCTTIEHAKLSEEGFTETALERKLEKFKESAFLSSVEKMQPNDRRIRRAFLASNVPVIYHFSIGANGLIGWVDIYFLRILRKLQDACGFVPHVFISESQLISPDTRRNVEKLLSRILGDKYWAIWWSSTIDETGHVHRAYAEAHRGIGMNYFIDLENQNAETRNFALPGNKTDRWLIFQIWLSRVMPTQVILAFHERKPLYDKLFEVPGLEPIIIYGDTLELGEDPSLKSKIHARVQNLGVLPQSIDPLVQWFESELGKDPSVGHEALQRFVDYFEGVEPSAINAAQNDSEVNIMVDKLAATTKKNCVPDDLLRRFAALACGWKREFTI